MAYAEYSKFLRKFARVKKPLKVVADASDGSVGPLLRGMDIPGLKIFILNGRPDGEFPAHGPDPTDPSTAQELSREVRRQGADFGAIFDGDGDRIFFVDERGMRISPDAAALLIAGNFQPPFVVTPAAGWIFRKSFRLSEIKVSRVGRYFLQQEMQKCRAKFGAETSGHYYFEFDFKTHQARYDSALRALVEFASAVSVLKKKEKTLSGWLSSLPAYYNLGELNFKAENAVKILKKIRFAYARRGKVSTLDGLAVEAKDFWFNLRPSQTEPLLRLNLEAKDKKTFSRELGLLKKLILG